MALPRTLLLDTNVWIDNYLGTRSGSTASQALIDACGRQEISLCLAALSLKDLYYQIGAELKREQRASDAGLKETDALAIEEVAWQCALNAAEQATLVPVDASDLVVARCFHRVHADLEDDFILAAAERSGADYLVTSDKKLLEHAPIAALAPGNMLALLDSFNEAGL